ncbi:hypothetical protein HY379_00825 [Candidatus Saccharibacteria bacterium]|nr:hypothetical protein [Candidatus Saccharibacteria bacterium]
MNEELLSAEAEQLYKQHKWASNDVRLERDIIEDATRRIVGLRSGRERTSWGLGGDYAERQADIVAENIDRHSIPRRDEAQTKYDANLKAASAHKDQHFEDYVDMAETEMRAHEASNTPVA